MELEKLSTRYTALAPDRFAVLEGLIAGGPYRYGDTSVFAGGTKSGGFSCPNDHAVNIVALAHPWGS